MTCQRLLLLLGLAAGVAGESAAAAPGGLDLAGDDECGSPDSASCAVNALQLRAAKRSAEVQRHGADSGVEAGCHTMVEGEGGICMEAINWAKKVGYPRHPDWYPGMDPATTPLVDWQFKAWNISHPKCPKPCGVQVESFACHPVEPPEVPKPKQPDMPVQVKILSYNLYWWNLFKIRGGRSAGELIRATGTPEPYDVMGFQECEDEELLLGQVGLLGEYTAFLGSKATCMAYRTSAWSLLDKGESEVAEDMRTEHYGRRIAQWMRLQHKKSGMTLVFVNHHGPLSVNSGGACGGVQTANSLLRVLAGNAQPGDVLVLVGDFNANAASLTVQSLWPHLTHVFNSASFGGVDNIFSNVPRSDVLGTYDLGSGGSDHHAISAVLELGRQAVPAAQAEPAEPPASAKGVEPAFAVDKLEHARGSDGCLLEPQIEYTFPAGTWVKYLHRIAEARGCCGACQGSGICQGWVWKEWDADAQGPLCSLHVGAPTWRYAPGFVSGLPKSAAVRKALAAEGGALRL